MKFLAIVLFLFALAIFLQVSEALRINVSVGETLEGRYSEILYEPVVNVLKAETEFHNSGTVAYGVLTRLDVFNHSKLIYSGWAKEVALNPADRGKIEIYWYANQSGNFSGKLRFYFAKEIIESELFNFTVERSSPRDVFEVKNVRIFDDAIRFSLKSNETVRRAVVIPSGYPIGWVVEQATIKKIEAGGQAKVAIGYEPTIYKEIPINMTVISEDGRFYKSFSFTLTRETGIMKYIKNFVDILETKLN